MPTLNLLNCDHEVLDQLYLSSGTLQILMFDFSRSCKCYEVLFFYEVLLYQ